MSLPAICARPPRSYAGAMRQYNALLRRYRKVFAGGFAFGADWRTFRIIWPEGCAKARELVAWMNDYQQRANVFIEIPARVPS